MKTAKELRGEIEEITQELEQKITEMRSRKDEEQSRECNIKITKLHRQKGVLIKDVI